jgi:hypothetical protein
VFHAFYPCPHAIIREPDASGLSLNAMMSLSAGIWQPDGSGSNLELKPGEFPEKPSHSNNEISYAIRKKGLLSVTLLLCRHRPEIQTGATHLPHHTDPTAFLLQSLYGIQQLMRAHKTAINNTYKHAIETDSILTHATFACVANQIKSIHSLYVC